MAELSVELTASTKKLKAALDRAEKKLKETGEVAEKSGDKISKTGEKGAAGITKLGKSTVNTTPALLEFNRTIQDAPFGIQGVANNIQQLTANFGSLAKNAGGTLPALRAMVAGLAGPQGVLLAVSAVTSLLVAYGDELLKSTSATKELAKASAEFVSSALNEINTIQSLVKIAADANQSYKVRVGALDELNDKYSDYLGNLSLEEVASNSTRIAVDNLTKSLLQQAKVRGVEALISERIADSSEDLSELLVRQKSNAKAVGTELQRLNDTYNLGIDLTQGYKSASIEAFEAINKNLGGRASGIGNTLDFVLKRYGETSDELKAISSEIENDIKPLNEILTNLKIGELSLSPDSVDGVTVIGKLLDPSKFKNNFQNLDDIFGLTAAAQNSLDKLSPVFDDFNVKFNKFGEAINFSLKNSVSNIKPQLSQIENALIEFNNSASQIINQEIVNTFVGLGEGIGGALVNGANIFRAVGDRLLSAIGSTLKQLGELAIATGVGVKAIKTSLKTLNPYVAIAAGVALVALGSAVSSKASSLGGSGSVGASGFGTGSVSGQGSSSSGSFGGGSVSSGSGGLNGRVVFEIAGTKLLGVLENTQGSNLRIGG